MSDVALSRGNWLERTIGALGRGGGNVNLYAGAAIVIGWALIALLAPWIAPYDPIAHNLAEKLQAPNLLHPFGTDNFGRDILARVMHGARIDLQMGILGVLFPFMIGTTIGAMMTPAIST